MNEALPVAPRAKSAMQEAINILVETSRVVGQPFFPLLAEGIARSLSVRWVIVASFNPPQLDTAHTLAFWDNGPADNFTYDLRHTPCADVARDGLCSFADNIIEEYPLDSMLVTMGAKSYAGTALHSADGQALGLIAVLDEEPFEDAATVEEIISLFSGRAAAELERLATSSLNERLGRIVEASVSEAFVFDGDTYRFELVNHGARENLGYTMEELRALTPWDLKPEYTREQFIEYVAPLKTGEVSAMKFETVHARKDGSIYPVAVELQFFPDAGRVFFASIIDETERKARDEHERLIFREMNHRAKNVLAVVQVLVRQTARRSPEDYVERIEARIAALSASHDVLVNNAWQDVPLEELVRSQLGHFTHLIGNRIVLSGPPTSIRSAAAQGLGLAMHELSTNAVKYGSLSNSHGKVEIDWGEIQAEDGEPWFTFEWHETGGPPVVQPEAQGFGTVMIEKSFAAQFGGKVDTIFDPEGVRCTMSAPAQKILAG